MSNEEEWREAIAEIEDLQSGEEPQSEAWRRLELARSEVIAAWRSTLDQQDPGRPTDPDQGPIDEPLHPPQEPTIRPPRRRDLIWDQQEGRVVPSSEMAERVLPEPLTGPYAAARALKRYLEVFPGTLPVVGVRGFCVDPLPIQLAGGYDHWDPRSVTDKLGVVNAVFIAESPGAQLRIGLGSDSPEEFGELGDVGLYGLDLVGAENSFGIQQLSKMGGLLLDDCRFLVNGKMRAQGKMHSSFLCLDHGYRMLVISRQRKSPDSWQHHGLYDKRGGQVWILNSDLSGGNRTASQARPHPESSYYPIPSPRPSGVYVVKGCTMDGFALHNPLGDDGGSVFTNWCNLEHDVWYLDNTITDARYGCLAVSFQPPANGNYTLRDGRSVRRVMLGGNTFTNESGDRAAVSISGAQEVHFLPGNVFRGGVTYSDLTLDGKWEAQNTQAKPNGRVFFHRGNDIPRISTWDRGSGAWRFITMEQAGTVL